MHIKHFSRAVFVALLLCVASAISVSAQTAEARGKVVMRDANGAETPVKGAQVTMYRTDIKGKYEVKTNGKGEYVRVGLPFSGTYTIIVSAPNARPTYREGVRFNTPVEVSFALEPGDGSTLTLEQLAEAKKANSSTTTATTTGAATTNAAPAANTTAAAAPRKESAEEKKAREELEKKAAEITAKNARATELNAKLPDILKQANAFYDQKKYDEAIAKYDEGLALDPEQGVFHQNKSVSLRQRAISRYNDAVRNTDKEARKTGVEAARNDMKAAVDAAEKGVAAYKAIAVQKAGDAQAQQGLMSAYDTRRESYVLAMRVGVADVGDKAVPAIQEYVDAEPDAAKKSRAQAALGDALLQSGQTEQAVATFQKVLATNPNNLDALYGLGVAYSTSSKNSEAVDTLKQFISKANGQEYATKKQEAQALLSATEEAMKTDADQKNKPAPRTGGTRRRGN